VTDTDTTNQAGPTGRQQNVDLLLTWRRAMVKSDLAPMTRLVLHTIVHHFDANVGFACPAERTIAKDAGVGLNTANIHIGKASLAGWIAISKKGNGRGWRHHEYRFTIPDGVPASETRQADRVPTSETRQQAKGVSSAESIASGTAQAHGVPASETRQQAHGVSIDAPWCSYSRNQSPNTSLPPPTPPKKTGGV
jgi:hypothetical protein